MFEEFVGMGSVPVRNVVEPGAVRRFAEAIGDPNPIYLDEEYAKASVWGRCIAPPTFARLLDYGSVRELELPESGVIHTGQEYSYSRPIFVGEVLSCHGRFVDTYTRTGRDGALTFLVFERVAEDDAGNEVVRSREVYVITAAVGARENE